MINIPKMDATLPGDICVTGARPGAVLSSGGESQRLANNGDNCRIRVMHFITGLDVGGSETMLFKLLSASCRNWSSLVVSLGVEGPMAPRIRQLGVPVHCLGVRRRGSNPFRLYPLLSLVRRFRPQIIQGWLVHGNYAASLAGLASSEHIPVFWNIRHSLYSLNGQRLRTAAMIRAGALLSSLPEKVIYASSTSARHHERLGYASSKSVIVPNGFDCRIFHPDEEARPGVLADLGIHSDAVLVGLVARYHPMKDHAGFLRAAGIVARKYSSAHFLLAGRGVTNDQPQLEKIIDDQALRGRVSLLGERLDVSQITAALDIACSSSWSEGFPNSIGEAMACGVPCVVTDVGDSSYLVGDTGLTVPPRDPEGLARAVCELIGSGSANRKELGNTARTRIKSQFSLPEVARRYQDLYRGCLQSAK